MPPWPRSPACSTPEPCGHATAPATDRRGSPPAPAPATVGPRATSSWPGPCAPCPSSPPPTARAACHANRSTPWSAPGSGSSRCSPRSRPSWSTRWPAPPWPGGQRFLRRWVAEVRDRLGLDGDEGTAPSDPSGVHLSPGFEGRWRLDGNLTTEQGEILAGAIEAQVDAMFHTGTFTGDDGLTPAERRAIALVELVTRGTRSPDDDGCARPLVLGVLDLRPDPDLPTGLGTCCGGVADPALRTQPLSVQGPRIPGALAGMAEAERAGVVSRATVERWLCEGTFQAVTIGPDGALNMGRKVRTATRAQRRALRVRDGHCVFPGCSAPPDHCQAHHIVWWEHDGPTDLDNLVLLCRHHHAAVHDRGFTITRENGIVEVRRPDGTSVTSVRSARADHRRGRPPPRARDPIDQPDADEVMTTRAIRRRVDALIAEVQGLSPARP